MGPWEAAGKIRTHVRVKISSHMPAYRCHIYVPCMPARTLASLPARLPACAPACLTRARLHARTDARLPATISPKLSAEHQPRSLRQQPQKATRMRSPNAHLRGVHGPQLKHLIGWPAVDLHSRRYGPQSDGVADEPLCSRIHSEAEVQATGWTRQHWLLKMRVARN